MSFSDDDEMGLDMSDLEDDDSDFGQEGRGDGPSCGAKEPKTQNFAGKKRHLDELKSILDLDAFEQKKDKQRERRQKAKARKKAKKAALAGKDTGLVQTVATKTTARPPAEVVVFSDPRKRSKKKKEAAKSQVEASGEAAARAATAVSDSGTFTMKDARFDVFKFGVSGLKKNEQEDAKLAHLVRLGAKPPKNKCVDYVEYKETKRKEKAEEARRKELARLSGASMLTSRKKTADGKKKKAGVKESSKKTPTANESIQTKVGRFDGGMLRISAKELAKIRGK